MHCPHCGAPVEPGVRFCPSCRKRVVPPSEGFGMTPPDGLLRPPSPPAAAVPPSYQPPSGAPYQPQVAAALFPPYTIDMRRPGIVTAMAVLNFVGGGVSLLLAAFVVIAGLAGGKGTTEDVALMVGMGGVYGLFGAVHVVTGVGLLKMRNWARITQIVLACLGILSCGIVLSVLMLIYLFKPGVKVLFSGRTADQLTPQEAADVAQLRGGSNGVVIALVVVVVVLMMAAVIGIVAAIAIPSLLRARISANESSAIGNVRTVVSAEAAYQAANVGYFDVPACLYAPEPCLRAPAPRFLDPQKVVFDAPKNGYVLTFHPGENAASSAASPSSLMSFAVVAVPANAQGGVRSFCGDSTGVVCTLSSGGFGAVSADVAAGGRCPDSCQASH